MGLRQDACCAGQDARSAAAEEPAILTQTVTGTGDDTVAVDLGGNPAILSYTCVFCTGNAVAQPMDGTPCSSMKSERARTARRS